MSGWEPERGPESWSDADAWRGEVHSEGDDSWRGETLAVWEDEEYDPDPEATQDDRPLEE